MGGGEEGRGEEGEEEGSEAPQVGEKRWGCSAPQEGGIMEMGRWVGIAGMNPSLCHEFLSSNVTRHTLLRLSFLPCPPSLSPSLSPLQPVPPPCPPSLSLLPVPLLLPPSPTLLSPPPPRHVPGNIYKEKMGTNLDSSSNELVIRIQPKESIYLKINNKV